MKKMIFALLLLPLLILAQSDLDRVELKNGKIFDGKVIKVTSNTIEFIDNMTNLNYEFQKAEIKYLRLTNGTILTFDDRDIKPDEIQKEEQEVIGSARGSITEGKKVEAAPSKTPENAQPIEIEPEEEKETNISKTIVTVAGAAVGVILLALIIF